MLPKYKGCGQVSKLSFTIDYLLCDESERKILLAGDFTGSVLNLPSDLYHSLPYISSSQLKYLYSHSPAHYYAKFIAKTMPEFEPTPQMIFGTACHSKILTPKLFDNEVYVCPKFDGRTKEGKELKAKIDIESAGKVLINEAQFLDLVRIDQSVKDNQPAKFLLDSFISEVSLFWRCPGSGMMMKARLDGLHPEHFIELKTAKDASPAGFTKAAFNLNYDLSAAHYLEGVKNVFGFKPPVYFIVVETEAPFVSQVYLASDEFLELGFAKWLEATETLSSSTAQGNWPGYAPVGIDGILVLSPPAWMNRKEANSLDEDEGF